MKKGGGRQKGNRFERQIAGMIIAAFKEHGIEQKDCFRTPLSGGHRFANKTDPGDIQMTARLRELFPFSVECKFWKKVNLAELLEPLNGGIFAGWWQQAVDAANGCDGGVVAPLLVFKQNNMAPLCVFHKLRIDEVKIGPHITCKVGGKWLRVIPFERLLTFYSQRGK